METDCGLISGYTASEIYAGYTAGWYLDIPPNWQCLLLRKGLTKCVDRVDTARDFLGMVGNLNIEIYCRLGGSKPTS